LSAWNKSVEADEHAKIARTDKAEALWQEADAVKQCDEANVQRDKAVSQRKVAEKRMRMAQAQQLAAQSKSFRESFPKRSLLLAVAGVHRTSKTDGVAVPAAEESLLESLSVAGGIPVRGHENSVTSVAFCPDGKRLASGSDDKTVRLWSVDVDQLCKKPVRWPDVT
jgi:hypothetical protein